MEQTLKIRYFFVKLNTVAIWIIDYVVWNSNSESVSGWGMLGFKMQILILEVFRILDSNGFCWTRIWTAHLIIGGIWITKIWIAKPYQWSIIGLVFKQLSSIQMDYRFSDIQIMVWIFGFQSIIQANIRYWSGVFMSGIQTPTAV